MGPNSAPTRAHFTRRFPPDSDYRCREPRFSTVDELIAKIKSPTGKGIRTIIQMVQLTRQDCAIASAGLMRSGLAHALHHARHRSVFQKHLADQPLMQVVLADMALHVEASVALVQRTREAISTNNHNAARARAMPAREKTTRVHRYGLPRSWTRRGLPSPWIGAKGGGKVSSCIFPKILSLINSARLTSQ